MVRLSNLIAPVTLDEVFTPGSQPTITYVDRAHLSLEASLKKAVRQKGIIVSLTGATKAGKTVLCRNVMAAFEYVWVDGGQVKSEADLWIIVQKELRIPDEWQDGDATAVGQTAQGELEAGAGTVIAKLGFKLTAGGSRLRTRDHRAMHKVHSMHSALEYMLENGIALVIDDFHYLPDEARTGVVKSIKGTVYQGLKVVLLSTPHRAFEAIKSEGEITGRFKHVSVPDWSRDDLRMIATLGLDALNISYTRGLVDMFVEESEGSPLLMQQFCWNLCYDLGYEEASVVKEHIPLNFDPTTIFAEVARDAGLPIYEKLKKGPQTRTDRIPRPLTSGGSVDIYQALLLAIASTGPREKLSYDQIRAALNTVLADKIPQKLEVSNALNHLAQIDQSGSRARAIDWNGDDLELVIVDPFFRFYLRWEVAKTAPSS